MLTAEAPARRAWSLAISFAVQACLLLLALLAPLIFTYRLPLEALGRATTLLLPPQPPAPPPPPIVKVTPQAPKQRFEAVLRQPRSIPDDIALVEEDPTLMALRPPEGTPGGVFGGVPLGFAELSGLKPPPIPKPIRVGGQVQAARLLNRILPVYPTEALEENIAGTVSLRAVIGLDGEVKDLRLIEGHPLLAPAAIEAVSQWRYKPTLLNGSKVEVITEIAVNFTITAPPEDESDDRKKRRRR